MDNRRYCDNKSYKKIIRFQGVYYNLPKIKQTDKIYKEKIRQKVWQWENTIPTKVQWYYKISKQLQGGNKIPQEIKRRLHNTSGVTTRQKK